MVIFTLGYNHFLNNYNSDCTQDRNKTQTILKRKKKSNCIMSTKWKYLYFNQKWQFEDALK